MLGPFFTIRLDRPSAVSERLAREREIPAAPRHHRRTVRRSGAIINGWIRLLKWPRPARYINVAPGFTGVGKRVFSPCALQNLDAFLEARLGGVTIKSMLEI